MFAECNSLESSTPDVATIETLNTLTYFEKTSSIFAKEEGNSLTTNPLPAVSSPSALTNEDGLTIDAKNKTNDIPMMRRILRFINGGKSSLQRH